MEYNTLRAAIEALLYVADEPLPLKKIRESIGDDLDAGDIKQALDSIVEEYGRDGRGVRVAELAGGYQVVTRPEYSVYVKKLQNIKPPRLSHQALETLSIIAYRQPIIRAEIEAIRGVNAGGVLKTLLERRLIKIAGRQDVPGKPMMYSTTREFLRYFGMNDLSSLPSLRELERELGMEEGSVLKNLEPELPGLDGPEMEEMAAEYRARKAEAEAAEMARIEASEAALTDDELLAELESPYGMDDEYGDDEGGGDDAGEPGRVDDADAEDAGYGSETDEDEGETGDDESEAGEGPEEKPSGEA